MLSRDYGLLPHVLSEQMLAAEEAALLALYRQEPWGDVRSEVSLAQIAQILWNVNAKKDQRKKLVDFLPWHKSGKPKAEEVDNKLEVLKLMYKDSKI